MRGGIAVTPSGSIVPVILIPCQAIPILCCSGMVLGCSGDLGKPVARITQITACSARAERDRRMTKGNH